MRTLFPPQKLLLKKIEATKLKTNKRARGKKNTNKSNENMEISDVSKARYFKVDPERLPKTIL